MKRSFSKTDNGYVGDELYYKRQKVKKHSEEDINNATITATGYMTRNRLKKQLKSDCSEDIVSNNTPVKAKHKRNRTSRDSASVRKNRLIERGYIFSQDICSTNLDTNLVTHTKCAPSLFDSDSEPEIINYEFKTSTKSETKENSINPEIEPVHSGFNKSSAKTYFNKKLCSFNDKPNHIDIKLDNLEKSYEGETVYVTESFLKQLKEELQIKNTTTKDTSQIHKLPSDTKNTYKSNILNIEVEKSNGEHNSEAFSAVYENKSRSHELSSETNTVKSVVLNKEEKGYEVLNSEVYENSDLTASLSNEINELNNLLDFELENMNSEQTHTSIIDDVMCNDRTLSPGCNGSLLNINGKVDDLEDFKLQPITTTGIATNDLSSIFDLPKDEMFLESRTEINQNNFNESSISDSVTSNILNAKEMSVTNNNSPDKLNYDNLVNQNSVCILDDMIDDTMSCSTKLSSCSNDFTSVQDTDIYDLIKPKSPNIIVENTSPRKIDLPIEKSNPNETFARFQTETLTDVPEEIMVPSGSQIETYCDNSLLVDNADLNKLENSPLQSKDVIKNNFINYIDLLDKTTIEMFADPEQNINKNCNLYSDSDKMSTDVSKETSDPNNVKISTIENNISDKLVKNRTIYSLNKLQKEENNYPTVKKKITSNVITNPYIPAVSNHNKKRKSSTITNELIDCDSIRNSLKITENSQHDSECLCKVFYNFNKDANQILTSKVNHTAFNIVAKDVRQKFHELKKFEANLLTSLINSDKKNQTQSEKFIPIFDTSISYNLKHKKFIKIENNDHIEPKIILKDACVDVDYLSNCDYNKDDIEFSNRQNISESHKLNFQSTKKKPTNSLHLVTNKLQQNHQKQNTNVEPSIKSHYTSKAVELMANKDEQTEPDFELKTVPYCQSNGPNILTVKNNFNKECEKSLINITKNHNELKIEDEINNTIKPIFSPTGKVQFIKDELEQVTDTVLSNNFESSNKSLFDVSYFDVGKLYDFSPDDNFRLQTSESLCHELPSETNVVEPVVLNIEDEKDTDVSNSAFFEKCEKSLTNIPNNHNESKNILPDKLKTGSVFSKTKKVLLVKSEQDRVTASDFESKPLHNNCLPNEPNILTIENKLNKESEKSSINKTSNHDEPKNILPDENEPKFVFSSLEKVQFVKDKLDHVSDSMPSYSFQSPSENLFNFSNFDVENSYGSNSDDDCKLQINDLDDVDVDKNSTVSSFDNSKNTITTKKTGPVKNGVILLNTKSNKSSSIVHSSFDNSKNSITTKKTGTIDLKNGVELSNTKSNKSSTVISFNQDHTASKSSSLNDKIIFANQNGNTHDSDKEKEKSLEICWYMTVEMCNGYYEKRSLNKDASNNKYEHFSKHLKDIFEEMFVYEIFVPLCQHINDLSDDNQLETKDVLFPTDSKHSNTSPEQITSDNKTKNELKQYCSASTTKELTIESKIMKKQKKSDTCAQESDFLQDTELHQSKKNKEMALETEAMYYKPNEGITKVQNSTSPQKEKLKQYCLASTTKELTIESKIMKKQKKSDMCAQESNFLQDTVLDQSKKNKEMASETEAMNHKPNEGITKVQNSTSPQKENAKSNIKIRLQLREMINSDALFDTILESTEFRNLRFFSEKEIACSICVLIFEQTIKTPVIYGLKSYKECDIHLNNEEKCKLLRGVELKIVCPKITKLTSLTLALAKMLRSDTLIECVLDAIKQNVFNKKMATDHLVNYQLMKFVTYFGDLCVRSRLLKPLQTFIVDSMVFLPNKYCCVMFISLLLWKNCFPLRLNNKQDPVLITVLSHLIIKKKVCSEQTIGGYDIFQQELINLLSVHFNYSFTLDLPTDFVRLNVHKPDFFVSVTIFLKCAHPKDLVEFIDVCLFPIIEDYLNTQHDDTNAIKIMKIMNMAIKPFRVSCNVTVSTYLTKCKQLVKKKDNKQEHISNVMFACYKKLLNKFIGCINDDRTRSQPFEELLVSIIMVLGSVDYLTSCMTLMKWKPTFQPSTILSEQFYMFKSILGHTIWDKLSAMDDSSAVMSMINGYLLGKNEFNTFERIHALHWK